MKRDELAARRAARGFAQVDLAVRVGVDESTIYRWEAGTSAPRPLQRRPLADALDLTLDELNALLSPDPAAVTLREAHRIAESAPIIVADWTTTTAGQLCDAIHVVDEVAVTADSAPRLIHEWLVAEPPQAVELTAGRRVGSALSARVARRVERLRHLDDRLAGADLQVAVSRELAATTALVRDGSYTDKVGRQLLTALGDLGQLAGWAAADAGQDRAAAHYYATGTAAAHVAGDRPLAGQLVSTLAYHVTNTDRARDAVLLAQSAIAGTHSTATATTRALFLDRLAWAHANAGDRRHTERTLGLAEEAFTDSEPGEDPPWTYWLTAEEMDVMAGRCFVALGLPDLACPRLARALGSYDEERPREAALYWSWLAEAELMRGDLDQAAALACRVLHLAGHTASTRSGGRADHLARLLRPHRGQQSVDVFEAQYQAAG